MSIVRILLVGMCKIDNMSMEGVNMNITFLKETQVSKMTGMALSTLRNNRHRGVGLPYYKIGKAVRYSLDDVLKYFEAYKIKNVNNEY